MPSTRRVQVLGYSLQTHWVMDFGRKHNVNPEGVKSSFACLVDSVELIRDELKKAGIYAFVHRPHHAPVSVTAHIGVASNWLPLIRGSTNKALVHARVEKLKKFLDTTDEPQWTDL